MNVFCYDNIYNQQNGVKYSVSQNYIFFVFLKLYYEHVFMVICFVSFNVYYKSIGSK